MAILNDFGVQAESLGQWMTRYENAFKAVFGEDVSTDTATAVGRIIREMALIGVLIDEHTVYVAAGLNLYQATGRQLTDYATLMGIPFNEGTRSTVTVTLSGSANTVVPEGTRFRTAAGAIFSTIQDSLIGTAEEVDVICRAERIGPVLAPAGEVNQIVDVISGLTGVSNAADGAPGKNAETEAEWVDRYISAMAVHGAGTLENVAARVADVPGVELVHTLHNPETAAVTNRGFTQAANSFSVIVYGSAAASDIARAIRHSGPPGMPMNGSSSAVLDGVTYRWSVAQVTAIGISITTTIVLGIFPGDGRETMTKNLVDFVGRLTIGQDLDTTRLRAEITAVQGHNVSAFEVTLQNGNALTDTTELTLWTLDADDVSITFET